MVGLDVGRAVTAAGFDDVGVEGALHEELDFLAAGAGFFEDLTLGFLEGADELLADDLALALGFGDALERFEEVVGGVDGDQSDAGGGDEVVLDLLDLAFAQQAVVDEHAGELVADGLVDEGGGDCGVDTAGQAADHFGVADLLADLGDLVLDDGGGVPVVGQAGALVEECLDELLAEGGVLDLGVPLHAVELAGLVLHGGDGRALGVGEHFEASGRGLDGDAVAHPRVLLGRGAGEQPVRLVDGRVGLAVFAERGLVDVGAERVRHGLEAVADAEHGHAGVEQLGVDARGAGLEYGCGAAGQDDGLRVLGEHLVYRHGMGDKLRIHVRLAHATGDELRVLGAEIDDKHRAVSHGTPFMRPRAIADT